MEILLTGRNGFLGREIYKYFTSSDHKVCSVVRSSVSNKSAWHIKADLAKFPAQIPDQRFDLVIHAAGKAHVVPKTSAEKETFYNENFNISKNLLAGLNQLAEKPKQFVFISSVAVYGLDAGTEITESTGLNAADPYGKSKIASELLITTWCEANNVVLTMLRLPLIAGENPPGNLGAMVKALNKGRFPLIADGTAKRSMVLAKDIPAFIDKIKSIGGIYHLTDGYDPSFKELAYALQKSNKSSLLTIPLPIAKIMAITGDVISKLISKDLPFNSSKLEKMTSSLTFSNKKAINVVDWRPTPVLDYYKNFR